MRLPHALCGAGHDAVRVGSSTAAKLHARIASARQPALLHDQRASATRASDVADRDALVHESRAGTHGQIARARRWRSSTLGARWEAGTWRTRRLGALRGEARLRLASTRTPSSTTGTCRPSSFVPRGSSSIPASRRTTAARQGHRVHDRAGWPGPGFSPASEVDRYFSNPSQALGYMLGQAQVPRAARPCGGGPSVRNSMCAISTPP